MAAKNKNKGHPRAAADVPLGPHEIVALHIVAAKRRDALLWEARDLQSAGKIRAARAKLKDAQEIQQRLHALETECRPANKSRDKRHAND